MKKKIKVLVLADSPLAPSGVGTQTRYMIEGMLRTQEFSFFCLAGAIKHRDYSLREVPPYNGDWIIQPVDGYGSPEIIRSIMQGYKPDVVWLMTDPRFWGWLWEMEDEIRKNVPMVYYHVWDNYPYPSYNTNYYKSNDVICTISKVTDDIVKTLVPEVESVYIPHTTDTKIFKKLQDSEVLKIREELGKDKFLLFWNNRNARRKQSGTLIYWFKEFLDKIGHDKATLVMHTEPKDHNGQNLVAIAEELGLDNGQLMLSTVKVTPAKLAKIYNAADCTVNIADAEGFGLSTLESLACETPIIVNMTGGLQEQVTDGENWFGVGINPVSKSIIGSQDVPFIYEDRINKEDFLNALLKVYKMSNKERDCMGRLGRKHVLENYGLDKYIGLWYETLKNISENYGSWESRKKYKNWEIIEL